jgi:hypothetical protein
MSDCTSMASSVVPTEFGDYKENRDSTTNQINLKTSMVSSTSPIKNDYPDVKKMYQEFVKIMLKVKFEKFNNTHSGQKIPEKLLFKECLKNKIPRKDWHDFIVVELQQPSKYLKNNKNDKPLTGSYTR